MVFLTALCYYNEVPRDFHIVENADSDNRTLSDIVKQWTPYLTNVSNISFDCKVFLNGNGYLPLLTSILEGSLQELILKLETKQYITFPDQRELFSVFLRVNFKSRMDIKGTKTRDDYWNRSQWNEFRQEIERAEGEHQIRLMHDYVMEIKSRIRHCPCKVCNSDSFDCENINRISDLQVAEMFEIWRTMKISGDKEEYVWSFFEEAVCTSDKSHFEQVYSFLDARFCFFGLSNLIGCGHWSASRIIKKWKKSVIEEEQEEEKQLVEQDDLCSRPKKKRRIETRRQIGSLTSRCGWCWTRDTRTSVTCQFLRDYMEFFIECPPDESRPRLPILVKQEVYENEYVFFMKAMKLKPVCYKWFNMIWQQQFGHCMMTDKRRFGQCNCCAELNRLYTLSCRTPNSVQRKHELLLIKSAHIEMIRNYRRLVTTWMCMAERDPERHLFVMMDGMDQNKTSMPSEGRHRKLREGKNLYGIKLTNALTSHGNFFFGRTIVSKRRAIKSCTCWISSLNMFERFMEVCLAICTLFLTHVL